MDEQKFKEAAQHMLMMQNNNDHNFKVLQYQIDDLKKQIADLNELRQVFHLPDPRNLDREAFDVKAD